MQLGIISLYVYHLFSPSSWKPGFNLETHGLGQSIFQVGSSSMLQTSFATLGARSLELKHSHIRTPHVPYPADGPF